MLTRVKYTLLLCASLLSLGGCSYLSGEEKNFYNSTAGFDILHIPIFPNYHAHSIDKGRTWHLEGQSFHIGLSVHSLGVTNHYIYGSEELGYSGNPDRWFLADTYHQMLAMYETEDELDAALARLEIEKNNIIQCSDFVEGDGIQSHCYWHPEDQKTYGPFDIHQPEKTIPLQITVESGIPQLDVLEPITKQETGIYFFTVKSKISNGIISFGESKYNRQIPIKDSMVVQSFIKATRVTSVSVKHEEEWYTFDINLIDPAE
jgi:hypothetical protein